ncbi:MAG: hypothetical protein HDR86_03560 [Bacteroides sp.]|nr:hypothetical protein [Bacteroides sp.]
MNNNNLAYRLHEYLMAATEQFEAENPGKVDISIMLGAANIFLTGLLVNAPSKALAKETLAECHHIQTRLIDATPNHFFGKGLQQYPELN